MPIRYQGKLYRALNPLYAREPLSGRAAAFYGERFNPMGRPALYASLAVLMALREANQVGNLQPATLVAYEANIGTVFDGRDAAALAAEGLDGEALRDPAWRDRRKARGEALTQAFARQAGSPWAITGCWCAASPGALGRPTSALSCGAGAPPLRRGWP